MLVNVRWLEEKSTMKHLLTCAALTAFAAANLAAQQPSPPAEASTSINGKSVTIKYHSPSVRGRDIFGPKGLISGDRNYPVWRAGANPATLLHTELDLKIGDLDVPAGDYSIYVSLEDVANWVLIVNKQTGQWGLTYDKAQDLGRTKMTMSKPASKVESLKYTLTPTKLELAWDDYVASVPLAAK
jgi:hypothetical protein